ncbi:DinB family protein [Sporosarcina sp.]|uniref:DinB family protein n=1 Tax=Sporosarcina sp. TaxID=49982 RepID=UPI002633BDAC|nr:DinB family protein [Sporosarcina sp.]
MGAVQQFYLARGYTLNLLKKIDEDAWDRQPEGFSNTIRWNVGHVYNLAEYILSLALESYEVQHHEWASFFKAGTSPSDWVEIPPAEAELFAAMKDQGKLISELTDEQLGQALDTPIEIGKFITLHTVEDTLNFLSWHEGIHAGLIDGLARVNR